MLVQCLYASRSAVPIVKSVTESILRQSRGNNPARGISGVLCFTDTLYLQMLEGGRDEVCELFTRIARDERHLGIRILVYDEISERRFGGWTMGHVDIATVNPALLLKYSEKPALDPFACPGTATIALLHELVATASIDSRSA